MWPRPWPASVRASACGLSRLFQSSDSAGQGEHRSQEREVVGTISTIVRSPSGRAARDAHPPAEGFFDRPPGRGILRPCPDRFVTPKETRVQSPAPSRWNHRARCVAPAPRVAARPRPGLESARRVARERTASRIDLAGAHGERRPLCPPDALIVGRHLHEIGSGPAAARAIRSASPRSPAGTGRRRPSWTRGLGTPDSRD